MQLPTMEALTFYTRSSLSLAKVDDQIQAESWRDWSMRTHLLVKHADWLRLLAVLGSGELDWFSTGYYIPFSAIGYFWLRREKSDKLWYGGQLHDHCVFTLQADVELKVIQERLRLVNHHLGRLASEHPEVAPSIVLYCQQANIPPPKLSALAQKIAFKSRYDLFAVKLLWEFLNFCLL